MNIDEMQGRELELTKEKAIQLHRELWDWLSKNPKADKIGWPRWKGNGGDVDDKVLSHCFCCEYANNLADINGKHICENCPLSWPYNCCQQPDENGDTFGLFEDWQNAKRDRRVSIAEQIRDLPVRGV